ncbi:MAG: hypothetical protein PHD11_01615 [Bacteroidales bacterium]|nr:hypothetical protein [Bacteroidales bacterium]MDD4670053.1 hypothetical protein [Bacteroidales bacterium]
MEDKNLNMVGGSQLTDEELESIASGSVNPSAACEGEYYHNKTACDGSKTCVWNTKEKHCSSVI